MSFYGSSFSFNGVSCEEYGLMLYDFGSTSQGDSKFVSPEIYEDRVPNRTRSLFYGTNYSNPLEFTLVFGANEYAANQYEPLDRYDLAAISSWLLNDTYQWLVIDQPDMHEFRYRCIITDLETIEVAMEHWAYKCTVHCDSPYAYTLPMNYVYEVNDTLDINLHSYSTVNRVYYPKLSIDINGANVIEIINESINDEPFKLDFNGSSISSVVIDGETGVITGTNDNMYQYFNFHFPALVRGDNHLRIKGSGTYTFTCEFPMNIGG